MMRVCTLLGCSDYTMFLDLGPEVPKAITALRALISLLAPKKGDKLRPEEVLKLLREEMLARHGDDAGEIPVLKPRDVVAVKDRFKTASDNASAAGESGLSDPVVPGPSNAGKRPRPSSPLVLGSWNGMESHLEVEDERPARRRRLASPEGDSEPVESGRSAVSSAGQENSILAALSESDVSGLAGMRDAHVPSAGSERREAYLDLLRQVAELPAPVPDEDGPMLSGMMAMVRMGAVTAILGLEARRRATGGS
ncbi:hypothetical protein N0V93_010323 [Gnomoniopsis smithogilvyi]|uniref:Uncharacterized protein n=1 Tax=Gnomoniopsis smithogilvyi TaxID=1191159 RepID=A0A9W9CSL3_9PEZI|nr:hypothetical protein N0V93_010323 [Gnomoniopsis smithogilvyi]